MSADCALTAQMEDEAKRVRGTASSSGAPCLCRLYREQGAMFVKIHGVWLCPGFTSFPSLDKIQKTGQQHSDTLKVMKICRGFYYINRSGSTKKAFSNQIPAYSEAKRILSFHFGRVPVWMKSIKVIIGMGREGLWILTYYYSCFSGAGSDWLRAVFKPRLLLR